MKQFEQNNVYHSVTCKDENLKEDEYYTKNHSENDNKPSQRLTHKQIPDAEQISAPKVFIGPPIEDVTIADTLILLQIDEDKNLSVNKDRVFIQMKPGSKYLKFTD